MNRELRRSAIVGDTKPRTWLTREESRTGVALSARQPHHYRQQECGEPGQHQVPMAAGGDAGRVGAARPCSLCPASMTCPCPAGAPFVGAPVQRYELSDNNMPRKPARRKITTCWSCERPIALEPERSSYHCESCDVRGSDEPALARAKMTEQTYYFEDYRKLNSKKYRPMAARKESRNVLSGRR